MRITKSLLDRISSILDSFDNVELVYIKSEKDDRTDVTFMTTNMSDNLMLYIKNRLHPYNMNISTMSWPIDDGTSVKIELFDVEY